MFFVLAASIAAAAYTAPSQPQAPGPSRPLAQLADDLQTATAHAHLNDEQKARVQSDSAVLESARQASEQGRTVNRQQVGSAVRDIRNLAESGAFSPQDQQALRADILTLRKNQ